MADARKAKANPTRAFFVHTITKDISLEDCILDLIDNSVDGAWHMEGGKPITLSDGHDLSKYRIEVEFDGEHFRISDNCGGITLNEAAEYAFTFGRRRDEPAEKYSIGVYGIGMKRAIFKMGNAVAIRSTYKEGTCTESFSVPIGVKLWLGKGDEESWDFDIEPAAALEAPGVEIAIGELNENVAVAFGNPAFLQGLRRVIARDYALHLHSGLKIRINGSEIVGWKIEVRQSGSFEPMRLAYEEVSDSGNVNVEIVAGMAAPPPDSSDPEESGAGEDRSGWYVICNGRIVLAADKTSTSGWDTENWPKWHPQYSGFIGFILFASESASLLPLTTTKRNVDAESSVYRRAIPKMRDVSKQWIEYTNKRKQALEEAKRTEAEAKPLSIYEIRTRDVAVLPQLTPKPRVAVANIAYSMPRDKVRGLAKELGNINMSYRDVGIRSFEYSYAEYVGSE